MITSASGTKSVLFNSKGTKLYAMNLEGMSVYEFDRSSRKILREFKFRPTKGTGWDYEADTAIASFEEKPVEACFSNNDKILWVSLHNAGGIVPIIVDSFQLYPKKADSTDKHITVSYPAALKKILLMHHSLRRERPQRLSPGPPMIRTYWSAIGILTLLPSWS